MERIKIDEFTKFQFISGVEYSPSGEQACFVVHQADLEENSYISNLWVLNNTNDQLLQLTSFDQEKGFIWLDDNTILFPGLRNPKDKEKADEGEELTVFYKININGGEAKEAFRIPFKVKQIRQVDQTRFVFTSTFNPAKPNIALLSGEDRKAASKMRKENKDYEVLEEIPFWSNGEGFVSRDRTRLFIFDTATEEWEALSEPNLQVEEFRLNESRSKVAIVGQEFQGKQERETAIYILSLEETKVHRVTAPERILYSSVYFLTDTHLICLANEMSSFGMSENHRFYEVAIDSGERKLLTPDLDMSTSNTVGSDCRHGGSELVKLAGSHLYFVSTEGAHSFLNRLDVQSGTIEKLTKGCGSIDSYAVSNGKILFAGLRDLRLQELYRLEDGEQQITHFNDWVQEQKSVASLESISVQTEGFSVDGWVMKPVGWEEGKKYPAILNIHGGPKTVYGEVFHHEMQYWANEGYFVLFCNPRGSDGKGNEFADLRGKYGTIDYEDIMRFTDAVQEKYPSIDADRMGVTGGSYGGYMTNWIIGQTTRFKAAAAQRSISNWASMACTTDIGYFFVPDQMAATPWTDPDKLWGHSPLKYADKVSTPTLFIHSEEDYRCWLAEGLQMFTALKFHGVESRLCMFRGENHELSRSGKPKHRIRRLKEITAWFDKYLK